MWMLQVSISVTARVSWKVGGWVWDDVKSGDHIFDVWLWQFIFQNSWLTTISGQYHLPNWSSIFHFCKTNYLCLSMSLWVYEWFRLTLIWSRDPPDCTQKHKMIYQPCPIMSMVHNVSIYDMSLSVQSKNSYGPFLAMIGRWCCWVYIPNGELNHIPVVVHVISPSALALQCQVES